MHCGLERNSPIKFFEKHSLSVVNVVQLSTIELNNELILHHEFLGFVFLEKA